MLPPIVGTQDRLRRIADYHFGETHRQRPGQERPVHADRDGVAHKSGVGQNQFGRRRFTRRLGADNDLAIEVERNRVGSVILNVIETP